MTDTKRVEGFAKLEDQENFLQHLNQALSRAEDFAARDLPETPTLPLLFVVGAPRSGTTLLMQWLAASGQFAYPTNLMSRFYAAPHIGARIQQLLCDPRFNYRNELKELAEAGRPSWHSEVGKTSGILEPHEFFYFWRRFFPVDQAQKLTDEQLERSDPAGFAKGWASIEAAFGKPVAAKGILLQYDIDRLAEWLPTSVFLHIQRDPVFNVQSLLESRERVFGNRDSWFSVRPPEYEWLRHESAEVQVAGQVVFTNRRISQQLDRLPPGRVVRLKYERFCSSPKEAWAALGQVARESELTLAGYLGPDSFKSTNRQRLPDDILGRIESALHTMRAERPSPTTSA